MESPIDMVIADAKDAEPEEVKTGNRAQRRKFNAILRQEGLKPTKIRYAEAGNSDVEGTPANWRKLRIFDMNAFKEITRVVKVDLDEGIVYFYSGKPSTTSPGMPEIRKQSGIFKIYEKVK